MGSIGHDIKFIKHKNYFSVECYSNNNDLQGYVNFIIQEKPRAAWIYNIATRSSFQHQGVASKMMHELFSLCYDNNIFKVMGKFYPNGEGAQYSKAFWNKMGFEIYRDGYEQYIEKIVKKSDCKSHIIQKMELINE